jgi:hypothetical protein
MSIQKNLGSVMRLAQKVDGLIDEIQDSSDASPQRVGELLEKYVNDALGIVGGSVDKEEKLSAPGKPEIKQEVRELLQDIEGQKAVIERFRDRPHLVGPLKLQLANYYIQLGNLIITDSVSQIIKFSAAERNEINQLLQQAQQDAQQRQRLANILTGAVNLSKALLKLTVKTVA